MNERLREPDRQKYLERTNNKPLLSPLNPKEHTREYLNPFLAYYARRARQTGIPPAPSECPKPLLWRFSPNFAVQIFSWLREGQDVQASCSGRSECLDTPPLPAPSVSTPAPSVPTPALPLASTSCPPRRSFGRPKLILSAKCIREHSNSGAKHYTCHFCSFSFSRDGEKILFGEGRKKEEKERTGNFDAHLLQKSARLIQTFIHKV